MKKQKAIVNCGNVKLYCLPKWHMTEGFRHIVRLLLRQKGKHLCVYLHTAYRLEVPVPDVRSVHQPFYRMVFADSLGQAFWNHHFEGGLELFLEFLLSCSFSSCIVWLSWAINCVCALIVAFRESTVDVDELTCCNNCLFISSFVNQTTFFR